MTFEENSAINVHLPGSKAKGVPNDEEHPGAVRVATGRDTSHQSRLGIWPAICCLLIVLLAGCQKSDRADRLISTSEFPLTLGNEWTYEFRDSLDVVRDTIFVRAVGYSTPSPGTETSIWEIHSVRGVPRFFVHAETLFVARNETTISIQVQNQCYPYLTLRFPLQTGSHWRTPDPTVYDSVHVVPWDTLGAGAGASRAALRIVESRYSADMALRREIWIARDVGIVQIQEGPVEESRRIVSWRLVRH